MYVGKPVHPAASVLPLMDGSDFDDLVRDIATIGRNVVPITLHGDMILDGRNRARAIELLQKEGFQIQPQFESWSPTGDETPAEYVQRRNLSRRSLTDDQKLAIVAKLLPMIEQERAERQAATRIKPGETRNPFGRRGVQKPAESSATPPDPEERRRRNQEKTKRSTAGQIAEKARVSVHKAKNLLKATKMHGPDVLDKLIRKDFRINELVRRKVPKKDPVPSVEQWDLFKAKVVHDYKKLLKGYQPTDHKQVREVLLEHIKAECQGDGTSLPLEPSTSHHALVETTTEPLLVTTEGEPHGT